MYYWNALNAKIKMSDYKLLIEILLDPNATICERDDAAMDLHKYANDEVLNALIKVAMNQNDDETVLDSCGESIGRIWAKKNVFDKNCYESLSKQAKFAVYREIEYLRPDWLKLIN